MPHERPLKVFYSYSRQDSVWRTRLANHLRPFELQGLIRGWHDAQLPGGSEWEKEINERLRQADIVLLLMSEDFVASRYCMEEYALALEQRDTGKCRVIPINLRAVEWWPSLKQMNAIPPLSLPIVRGTPADEDAALQSTAVKIGEAAGLLLNAELPPAPSVTGPSQEWRIKPPREITQDFAFLCNWADPETALKAAFLEVPLSKRRTPFLTLVWGHPDDCQEGFISRVRNSPLPGLLGVKTVNELAPLEWPDSVSPGLTTHQLFTWRVADALRIQAEGFEKMARRLPAGLTIIRSTIEPWTEFDERMIEAYAAFWNSWPPLPPGKAIAPCLCIKGDPGQLPMEALQERLNFARFDRLRGAVVGLSPIKRRHVLDWLIKPQIKPLYPAGCAHPLETEVQAIFAQQAEVRMSKVVDGLTQALQKHAGKHECEIA